jgi:hypothetical protein
MTLSKNVKQTIFSLLIISFLSWLAYWIVRSGDDFAGSIIVLLTIAVALGVAVLLLILRVVKYLKNPGNFLYNYIATLNLFLVIVQLLVVPWNQFTIYHVLLTSSNFLLGFTIYFDIYRWRKHTR